MTTQLAPPRRFVKAYHQHHHLVLQFIWTELILAHQALTQTKIALDNTTRECDPETSEAHLNLIIEQLTQLAGSAQDYMRLFGGDDDGIFNKLKNYCLLFSTQDALFHEAHLSMVQESGKAWLIAVEALGMIRTIATQTHSPNLAETTTLPSYITKLQKCLTRLVRLAAEATIQYKSNENVVYYLLRNHAEIDHLTSTDFVKKLLQKMFGKKLKLVGDFLIERYSARGFDHLIPQINSTLERLVHP